MGSWLAKDLYDERDQQQNSHQRNCSQRNSTVEAPDSKHIFFDVGKVERERQGWDGQNKHDPVRALQGKNAEKEISGYADYGDGGAMRIRRGEHGVGGVVHDAAIPAFVDVAGCIAVGAVVLAKGQRRGRDSDQGKNQQEISHVFNYSLTADPSAATPIRERMSFFARDDKLNYVISMSMATRKEAGMVILVGQSQP